MGLLGEVESLIKWYGLQNECIIHHRSSNWQIDFPVGADSDYSMHALGKDDMLWTLFASRPHDSQPFSYWFGGVEGPFDSDSEYKNESFQLIRWMLTSETRIDERQGPLFNTHTCFVRIGNVWLPLTRSAAWAPKIRLTRRKVWSSYGRPLVRAELSHAITGSHPVILEGMSLLGQQQGQAIELPNRLAWFLHGFMNRVMWCVLLFWKPRLLRQILREINTVRSLRAQGLEGLPGEFLPHFRLMQSLLTRVERASMRLGLRPGFRIVGGTLPNSSLSAEARDYFGSASVITVNRGMFLFCHLLSKALSPLLVASENQPGTGHKPTLARRWAVSHLSELIHAIVYHGGPGAGPPYPMSLLENLILFADELRAGMEVFIVGHEYAHLRWRRRAPPPVDVSVEHEEEIGADRYATAVVFADLPGRISQQVFALGPAILFQVLGLMEGEGVMPIPRTHPSSSQRADAFVKEFLDLARANDADDSTLGSIEARWQTWSNAVEELWPEVMSRAENLRR